MNKKAYHWCIRFDLKEKDLKVPQIIVFGGNQINSPIYYHDPTVRSDSAHFVFQYTISGEGCFRYKGEEHILKAGQGFFCNVHDPDMAYYYPPDGDQTYEMFFCCFAGSIEVYEELANLYGRIFEISADNQAIVQFLNYRVRTHYTQVLDKPLSESVNMASVLLTALIKSRENSIKREHVQLIDKVKVYVQENIEDKVSIMHLAMTFGVSASHLSREFKNQIGISPQKFIANLRMKHAEKLIHSSLLSIKEIAFRMGFDTSAHFIRSFKRVHGKTPGSLRK